MKLILGHNQFIGISHISESKSREQDAKFANVENIYRVVEAASDLGYDAMIIETHPRMLEFFQYYKKNGTFDMDFYLQVPYVHGYIQRMNENGIKNLLFDVVRQTKIVGAGSMALKGIVNILKRDYVSLSSSLLNLEMSSFADAKIKALLLHNVITDLLLSLGVSSAFSEYVDYVKNDLGVQPGFTTLNFPLLQNSFKDWGITPDLIMTPINPKGFDMNPSRDCVEQTIKDFSGKIIAMNVLGGGAFPVKDAHIYLDNFKNIQYCVVGASSREHLKELIETLGRPN